MSACTALMQALDFTFSDEKLLLGALTHRSYDPTQHNQRLEFLGDALLGWLVSKYVYDTYGYYDEGVLTRLRSELVSRVYLAKVARSIALADHILVDARGYTQAISDRVLADTLEAVFAAMYLDNASVAEGKIIACLLQVLPSGWPQNIEKDPKTTLQEYLQQCGKPLPEYVTTSLKDKKGFAYKVQVSAMGYTEEGYGNAVKPLAQRLAHTLYIRLRGE